MDDMQIVEAVRRGDVSAFGSLYAAHVGAVQTVVRSHVHDHSLAEDVVQDVFMRALESLPKLEDPARFRAWLMGIARHTAIDARRGIARLPESRDDAGAETEGGVEPDHMAELAELSALVWGAVAGLSPRDATAMALVSLGFGIGEVALVLEVTHGAAKVAVHRARQRARQALMVEVLVRRQAPVCAAVDPNGDVVALARHLRTCQECQGAARQSL
jgi:RNA polymerase sigma-70 factor (ECF subfamily)